MGLRLSNPKEKAPPRGRAGRAPKGAGGNGKLPAPQAPYQVRS